MLPDKSTAIDILESRKDAGDAKGSVERLESRLGRVPGLLSSTSSVTVSRCFSIVACCNIPYVVRTTADKGHISITEIWGPDVERQGWSASVAVPAHSHHSHEAMYGLPEKR